jgi:hypothetical protein
MKFSIILLATIAAAATALDFSCDRDDVAVCCRARDDDFTKCMLFFTSQLLFTSDVK